MNRTYRSLLIAILAGVIMLPAGLSWAQTKVQSQNPPQKKAVEQKKDEPQEPYTEEEYNAYEAASNEKDLDKKAAMIIAFVEKYPKSVLLVNITPLYDTLLYDLNKAGDYKKLEPLAEQWLKYNPNNLQLQAYIFDCAVKLSNHQKAVEFGEKIYAVKPGAELASVLYNNYDKLGNKAKKLEWHLKLLEYPEYNDNFQLRCGKGSAQSGRLCRADAEGVVHRQEARNRFRRRMEQNHQERRKRQLRRHRHELLRAEKIHTGHRNTAESAQGGMLRCRLLLHRPVLLESEAA
jgi:tetratricopeptide (TPR) repeat protein